MSETKNEIPQVIQEITQDQIRQQNQETTLKILNQNSEIKKMINTISENHQLNNFEDKSNIPIPFSLIERNKTDIFLQSQIVTEYQKLVKQINSPKLAFEYPFILVGHQQTDPDGYQYIVFNELVHTQKDATILEKNEVEHDPNKIRQALKKGDVIALGHTHPYLTDKETSNYFTNKINPDIKDEYHIKRIGLNLSLQDIYNGIQLKRGLPNKNVYSCLIMYNGEIGLIDHNQNSITKANNIIGVTEKEIINIPSPN
ncbi:MAG: hypothetical protein WDA13_00690 [Candidatus Shapirobacteria bacterium]